MKMEYKVQKDTKNNPKTRTQKITQIHHKILECFKFY